MDKKEPTGSTATNKTAGNADCTIRARPNGLPSSATLFFYSTFFFVPPFLFYSTFFFVPPFLSPAFAF